MAFGVDRVLDLGEGLGRGKASSGAGSDGSHSKENERILWFLMGTTGLSLLAAALASSGALTSYMDLGPVRRFEPDQSRGPGPGPGVHYPGPLHHHGPFRGHPGPGVGCPEASNSGKGLGAGHRSIGYGRSGQGGRRLHPDDGIRRLGGAGTQHPLPDGTRGHPRPLQGLGHGGRSRGSRKRPGCEDPPIHGVELAAGHHPNDLPGIGSSSVWWGAGSGQFLHSRRHGAEPGRFSILNVRYVIWPVYRYGHLPLGDPVMASGVSTDRIYEALYEIPTLPRARLVGDAVVLTDEEAVPYILSDRFRPGGEVVLEAAPEADLPGGPVSGNVEWMERGTNRMRLQVDADKPALLVLAENWYPAWKARIGGSDVPVLRANHSLRAVAVPAGERGGDVF